MATWRAIVIPSVILAVGLCVLASSDTATADPSSLVYVSDSETQVAVSYDGVNYGPFKDAVPAWVHDSWPTIEGATWISSSYYVENQLVESWRKFVKTFTIHTGASAFIGSFEIGADDSYEIYMNGELVGSRDFGFVTDKYDLVARDGENTLMVIVRNAYPTWLAPHPKDNPTGLIYKLDLGEAVLLQMNVDGCAITSPDVGDNIYTPGVTVPISAVPCPGWVFEGWTGPVADPSSSTTTVLMDADKSVTAHLSCTKTLTMQVDGSGAVTPALGPHDYECDALVPIGAEPDPGWSFAGWTGGPVTNPSSPQTTVAMGAHKTVTANFEPIPPVTLTMQANGCGDTDPPVGGHDYAPGTVVNISAAPCSNWTFVSWTGNVADPNSPTTTILMGADKTVTANFAPPVTLTLNVAGSGTTGPPVGTHEYGLGAIVSISAEPSPGWEFAGWTGSPVANPSFPATSVTMNVDKSITANFTQITHILTVETDGCGDTLPLVGSYVHTWGEVVDVSAVACPDWEFGNWTGDVADSDSATTTVAMDADKTITANFLPPFELTVQVNGCGVTDPEVGIYIYPPNSVVDISAIACPGWQFDSWTGDVGNSSVLDTTVTMDADKTVTVNLSRIPAPLGLQLAVILDGSASMEAGEWATQIDGLSDALNNGVIPRDGSVELTVIQFAHDQATTEVAPTIIDSGNWDDVAATVQAIVKRNGITPLALGIQKAVEEITGSPSYALAMKRVINLSSDVGEFTLIPGNDEAVAERNAAIAAGVDEINAEGIGDIRSVDMDWLRDSIVWPQPGTIAPPFNAGWVYRVHSAAEFTEAIGEKVRAPEINQALVISSSEGGSVTEPGEGIFNYSDGTVVDLVATSDPGWVFTGWTGDVADPSSSTTTITMNDYHIISAQFTEGRVLTVSSGEGGSVTDPGEGSFTYLPGTVVDLEASPDLLGSGFGGWTGNVAEPLSASTTITMTDNESVVANFFDVPIYTLTIDSGEGGSVTSPGEGAFAFNEGTVVELTATPSSGWIFVEWTGNVADQLSATTTIMMNQDQTVDVSFYELPIYRLAVGSTSGGTVIQPGEGVFERSEGSVVNLMADADTGYTFDGWIGNTADPWSSATTIMMNKDEMVTARFVKTYTLTVSSGTGGEVTDPGEGIFVYKQDTEVTLTAMDETGWAFDSWAGNVADPSAAITTITMTENRVVSASFVRAYILALSSSEGGTITTPGEGLYEYKIGTIVELAVQADFGRTFLGWAGNVANHASPTTSITMNRNEVVVASFSGFTMHTLTVQVNGNGTASPAPGQHEYAAGTVVNLLATPDDGNAFTAWTGAVADPASAVTTVTMDSDKTVTANFLGTFVLTMQTSGSGSTTPVVGAHTYPVGTVVDISAFPAPVRAFQDWTGDVANPNSAFTTVTIDSNKTVTANFVPITDGKTLVIVVSGGGATSPPPGVHLYEPGAVVRISATADAGWRFTSWSSNVATPTSPTTTISMSQNRQVTAYFHSTSGSTQAPPTPVPSPTPLPTRTPRPTRPPTPAPTATEPPVPTPTAVSTAAPTSTPVPTSAPPTQPPLPTLAPTPTPEEGPVAVPWSLVGAAVLAVVGVGILFYALGKRGPK